MATMIRWLGDEREGRQMTEQDIRTTRLRLAAWTPENIDAMIDRDATRLRELLGAQFPPPLRPAPETDDVLLFFRNLLATDELARAWPARYMIRLEDQMVLGSIGTGFPTGEPPTSVMGYGVYPEFEGQGYATEAAQGVVQWAFEHPTVAVVRATIHRTNRGSRRVAAKCGLRETGQQVTTDDGLLDVWEITRAEFERRTQ
jgi:RimJ/RimL family protein N-acetyltransferase